MKKDFWNVLFGLLCFIALGGLAVLALFGLQSGAEVIQGWFTTLDRKEWLLLLILIVVSFKDCSPKIEVQ